MSLSVESPPQKTAPQGFRQDYTTLAAAYDRRRFSGRRGEFAARIDREIVRGFVRETGASLVVDVPVGTARVADYLSGLDLELLGCDVTWAMLQCAASRTSRLPLSLVQADAAALPFPDQSLDCIISLRFFHLIPYRQRRTFADEFTRALKPGGHLICSFTNGWYAGGLNWIRKALGRNRLFFMKPNELSRLFPQFEVRRLRGTFLPLQYLVTFAGERTEGLSLALNSHFPMNRLCWERFYLLQKRA